MTERECMVHFLNKLNDKYKFLEIENKSLEHSAAQYAELYHKSLKEIEQLKLKNEELQSYLEILKADIEYVLKMSDEEFDKNKKLQKTNEKLKLENNGLRYALKNIKKIDVEIEVDDLNDSKI